MKKETQALSVIISKELYIGLKEFSKMNEFSMNQTISWAIKQYIGSQPIPSIPMPPLLDSAQGPTYSKKIAEQYPLVEPIKIAEQKEEPLQEDMSIPFPERIINKYFDNNFIIDKDNSDEDNKELRRMYIENIQEIHESEYPVIEKLLSTDLNDGKKDVTGKHPAVNFDKWLYEQKDWKMK